MLRKPASVGVQALDLLQRRGLAALGALLGGPHSIHDALVAEHVPAWRCGHTVSLDPIKAYETLEGRLWRPLALRHHRLRVPCGHGWHPRKLLLLLLRQRPWLLLLQHLPRPLLGQRHACDDYLVIVIVRVAVNDDDVTISSRCWRTWHTLPLLLLLGRRHLQSLLWLACLLLLLVLLLLILLLILLL